MTQIPEAAVEAAAIAMFVQTYERDEWETVINQTKYRYLQDARLALEAAAPYLLVGAWHSGYVSWLHNMEFNGVPTPSPYKAAK